MQQSRKIGVIWLTPANYDRAVALSDDGMPPSYEAWRQKIDRLVRDLPAGIDVVRVEVDPEEVAQWCRANGHRVNVKGRSAFAAFYMHKKGEH